MTDQQLFIIVQGLWVILPMVVAVLVYGKLSKTMSSFHRAALGIVVVYTVTIYNPAGIAAGYEAGMHFPESHYDNNKVSVVVVTGWFYPLLALAGVWVTSKIRRQFISKATALNPYTSESVISRAVN